MRQKSLWKTDSDPVTGAANLDLGELIHALAQKVSELPFAEKAEAINKAKLSLHEVSPFRGEPVDCVLWVKHESVRANDYNPNSVAPPEMELLRVSIIEDGYTQPVVTFEDSGNREVVDGFHRTRVAKECQDVRARVHGYLPVVTIRDDKSDKSSRMASTIRHNRARGKHAVGAMSDIVVELKRRNWTNERICRELGMDADEILRLCQITGLSELFSDQSFSQAWEAEGSLTEDDFEPLTDDVESFPDREEFRTVNTSDESRIFHTWDKWECHKAGFYASTVDGISKSEGADAFASLLRDDTRFRAALKSVISEWKHSCEHYLTNSAMNRIAWLGQASACYAIGLPAAYRSGWSLLTEAEQEKANATALEFLNIWLVENGRDPVSAEEAIPDRQAEIY